MSIQKQIEQDNITALKGGDKEKRGILSFIVNELKSSAKNKRAEELSDAETISALQKQRKQRAETLESAEKGGRADLAQTTRTEIAVIESYLPAAPSDADITDVIDDVIRSLGATSVKDIGKILAAAAPRLPGADKSYLSKMVKAAFPA